MQIDRSSWHYKMFSQAYSSSYTPSTVSLCEYFWTVVAMMFVIPIVVFAKVLCMTVYVLLWPLAALVGLLVGRLPTHFQLIRWEPYKPFQVKSFQFYPILVLWGAGAVFWAFLLIRFSLTKSDAAWYIDAVVCGLAFALPVVLLGLLCKLAGSIPSKFRPDDYYYKRPKKESAPGLFKSYLKAKKERICPIIEFTDGGIANESESL